MRKRAFGVSLFAAVIAVVGVLPAQADSLVQTFEHETWDEKPDQTLLEAIEALREVHPYLVDVRGLDMTRTARRNGFVGQGLQVAIPPGGFRGFGPYARLPNLADEAWFRYYIFLDGFHPVGSGKLPGLADASRTSSAKGCKPSTTSSPGWSARMMFDRLGTLGVAADEVPIGYYVYHLDQEGGCGDEWIFSKGLSQRRWTCIEGHVKMNTPGANNGHIEAWMDGDRVFSQDGLAFRRPGESIGVREMWNNVYFGGRYATPNTLRLVLDEIAVSTTGRVGCLDPFVDDRDNVHRAPIRELHARGKLFGCDVRRVCADDMVTRAEFAAMIHRVIRTPAGPNAFGDDNGHWGESALNSLASQGIIRGCNPPANTRACPDAQITRGEVAAIVRRVLGLPAAPNAFGDDNGHWAEGDINAIAALDITRGCGTNAFCPERNTSRGETASFTLRLSGLLGEVETLSADDLPDWPPPGPPPVKPPEERE